MTNIVSNSEHFNKQCLYSRNTKSVSTIALIILYNLIKSKAVTLEILRYLSGIAYITDLRGNMPYKLVMKLEGIMINKLLTLLRAMKFSIKPLTIQLGWEIVYSEK